ncbi:MAG: lysophospholipid acyltransferase family protein [Tissierellia bacterium]|nr:lysophospholipid acyltransferase family protein [Tissierellia bacterium]
MLYNILRVVLYPIFKLIFRLRFKNMPKDFGDDKLIICSNHVHLLDPLLLAVACKRKIHFLGKKELFKNKFFGKILLKLYVIPVDRQASDIRAIKSSLQVLKNNQVLGIFPEGTRVSDVSIENIKTGIGYLAYKSESDILPIQIVGKYGLFKRMELVFKEKIKTSDYLNLPKSEAFEEITKDVYNSIYNK